MTTEKSKRAGVIGWPVGHSKSPLIHGHWLEKYGIDGSYDALPVRPEELEGGFKALLRDGYDGFNVTVPHKQAIMPHLDFIRADAEKIGAVNTVIRHANGQLEGRNTDAFGFITNLREGAPELDLARGHVVVLGAGGAARAILYALASAGATKICIANRTLTRAKELATAFDRADVPVTGHLWDALPELLPGACLLVNTTSLGMTGQPALEIDLSPLPAHAVVNDIVYAPLETDLLKQAKERNLACVGGIGMLLHQARPAFQAWFGVMPDIDDALLKKVLG